MKRQESIKEFSRLPKQELQRMLQEKRENLRELRFDLAAGKIKNVRQVRQTRRDIARMLTLLKQK